MIETQARTLHELESVIERGQQTFIEVGEALSEIQERRLYRQYGYDTFEDYLRDRWQMKRRTAYDYIHAAEVAENVRTCAQTPPSLSQARELFVLMPEQQRGLASRVDFADATVLEIKHEVKLAQSNGIAVHFSSDSDEWYTPPEIIERTLGLFGQIDLDPCSNSRGNPNVPAACHYAREDNGLAHQWEGRVYMNPPYGRAITEWVIKLCSEHASGRVTEAIALVPARTDTDWFRQLRDCAICFIDGRLRFSGMANSAPFPSAVVYFGDNVAAFVGAFRDMGDIWVRWNDARAGPSGL